MQINMNSWQARNAVRQADFRKISFDNALRHLTKFGSNSRAVTTISELCKQIGISKSTAYEPQWKPLFDRARKEGKIIQ